MSHTCIRATDSVGSEMKLTLGKNHEKVLLTTTALVMTAGVAAADVSFSGSAQTGISSVNGADNVLFTH